MKIMETIPVRVVASIVKRQPRLVHCKIAYKQTPLRRFQHFIESTDWGERYLCNHWIDKICLGGIVVSALYFTTSLVLSFLS